MNMFCISQGSAVTFMWGQMHSHLCRIFPRFPVPTIIKIGLF